ncbi:MAG TPA: rhodanese-like domain-containing protein [Candidatus Limnocylindrales bacterium]|nr:rhodanese-like domain-containing protein [Candidatus Limnocylindrales bacterium]
MHRISRRALALVLVVLVATLVAACGGSGSAVTTPSAADAAGMVGTRVVIDVRTPAEFAAGHIAGAQNIDVEAGDFATRIASLDKGAKYLVYCRSGRRSAIAAQQMAGAGFKDIADGGGMEAMVAAGAPTE